MAKLKYAGSKNLDGLADTLLSPAAMQHASHIYIGISLHEGEEAVRGHDVYVFRN